MSRFEISQFIKDLESGGSSVPCVTLNNNLQQWQYRIKSRTRLELSLEALSQNHNTTLTIVKVEWIPDSDSKVLITTNRFVNLYDLKGPGASFAPQLRLNMPHQAFNYGSQPEIADSTYLYSPSDQRFFLALFFFFANLRNHYNNNTYYF